MTSFPSKMSSGIDYSRCGAGNPVTALFCNRCTTAIHRPTSVFSARVPATRVPRVPVYQRPVPSIESDELTILCERPSPMPVQLRRTTALSSTKPPQLGQLGQQEVQHHRQKAGILDKERQKSKGKNPPAFGLQQQPHDIVKRTSELYVVHAGQTATRHPSGLELLSFNPSEQVLNWPHWIRKRCLEFHGWNGRKDIDSVIDDLDRTA